MSHPSRRHFVQAGGLLFAGLALPAVRARTLTEGLAPQEQAAHALNRLGFGPRPGDVDLVARDVRGWIESQLHPSRQTLPAALSARLNEAPLVQADPIEAMRGLASRIQQNQQAAQAAAGNAIAAAAPAGAGAANTPPPAPAASGAVANPEAALARTPVGEYVRGFQLPAIESRMWRALESPNQLEEVMVDFWFNHFNVFQGKNLMRVLVGPYEHQAIRPHALGRFRDLLGATAKHPAMLYYLDNWQSVAVRAGGPGRGLNENYARELMELHTLGVDAGYSQQDVTQLARMLTGWTIVPLRPGFGFAQRVGVAAAAWPPGPVPGFWFNERSHDAGDKLWLGHRVPPNGQAEGEFALDLLARHPATAAHLAFKLAQYFVSDQPPAALVQQLARVFLAEDGQIVPVLRALFSSEAFWSPSAWQAKFKTPYHYLLSSLRAGGWQPSQAGALAGSLNNQGMPLYGCQTPDGYKNTEGAWLNPDGMSKRFNVATQVAQGRLGGDRLGGGLDAAQLMQQLGPLVQPATRELVARHQQEPLLATALVLAGPGMMRR